MHRLTTRSSAGRFACACVLAAAVAACGGGAAGGGSTTSGTAASPPATPTPSPAPLTLTEAQNGATVHATRGQAVALVLHSTYWKVGGSSNPAVLQPAGGPQVQPSPGCVMGQGCGTVTAMFIAAGDGAATLTATRTTCGEALRCTEAQGRFAVTVVVDG